MGRSHAQSQSDEQREAATCTAHELPVSIREIQEGALDELFKDADERPFADISTAPDADANSKKFLGRKGTR